jgi:hypothetical protein
MPAREASSASTYRSRAAWIAAALVATTAVQALLGRGTHPLNVVHVVFGALYFVPIVAAAVCNELVELLAGEIEADIEWLDPPARSRLPGVLACAARRPRAGSTGARPTHS